MSGNGRMPSSRTGTEHQKGDNGEGITECWITMGKAQGTLNNDMHYESCVLLVDYSCFHENQN